MVDIESFLEDRELEQTTKLDIFQMKPVTGLTELDEVAQGLAQASQPPWTPFTAFLQHSHWEMLIFYFFPPCISL